MTTTDDQQPRPVNWHNADAYERYVGRWSRLVAREFLGWLAVEPGRDWLDVGCGTGALSQTIVATADPATVLGIDPSPGFIAGAQRQLADPRVRFEIGDARTLPVANDSRDVVVSGLMLNFVPAAEQATAAREMRRVTRSDGVIGAYVWDYTGQMHLMRAFWDAAVALDPRADEIDESRRFPLCQPEPLASLFRGAGLEEVEVRAIDIPTVFRDFDDYWSPFLGGQGPAPAYAMSLDEERRAALRERIRADLPVAADGSIPLIARAWAVRGTVRPEAR